MDKKSGWFNSKLFVISYLVILFAIVFSSCARQKKDRAGEKSALEAAIRKIIDSSKADIGVAFVGLDFKDSMSINGDKRYPMLSVYKFPLAIAVLQEVEKGKLSLDQSIYIPKDSLDTATWSPMVKKYPGQDINITLRILLEYTVSKSDNNGCDALFKLMGGTAKVNEAIHDMGIKNISIVATEKEMKTAWAVQYTNWCTPDAMLQLLRKFDQGIGLSPGGRVFLMKLMTESENSPKRLKGLLPEGTVVAHKTGTSDTNGEGITAATNDVGIITLPTGNKYVIVVYESNIKGSIEARELTIAKISKLVWDYYVSVDFKKYKTHVF